MDTQRFIKPPNKSTKFGNYNLFQMMYLSRYITFIGETCSSAGQHPPEITEVYIKHADDVKYVSVNPKTKFHSRFPNMRRILCNDFRKNETWFSQWSNISGLKFDEYLLSVKSIDEHDEFDLRNDPSPQTVAKFLQTYLKALNNIVQVNEFVKFAGETWKEFWFEDYVAQENQLELFDWIYTEKLHQRTSKSCPEITEYSYVEWIKLLIKNLKASKDDSLSDFLRNKPSAYYALMQFFISVSIDLLLISLVLELCLPQQNGENQKGLLIHYENDNIETIHMFMVNSDTRYAFIYENQ